MIKGYIRLRNALPGSLIRLRHGSYAVVSEYRTANNGQNDYYDSYLLESGEILLANADDWVALINIETIEVEAIEVADYPLLEYPQVDSTESEHTLP